jgi:Ni/Co efflux regulator RcnB
MKATKWIFTGLLGILFLIGSPALAQGNGHGNGNGNGHGKGHDKHHDDEDRGDHYYTAHYQESVHGWYVQRDGHLPPGLAKKDQLPPGLEKQLIVRGTLPPGLRKHMYPCPEELEHRLPPPPPDCANVLIGGHIVLLNRKTNLVVDVFHVELF